MKFYLILLLFLVACSPAVVFDKRAKFSVELADTPELRSQGLMYRENLSDSHGMLFVFDDTQSRTFWMKNTLLPLDMIFIDDSLSVVEIKANVPPCVEDPCPTYISLPARYVLEVKSGAAEKSGVIVGSRMLRK